MWVLTELIQNIESLRLLYMRTVLLSARTMTIEDKQLYDVFSNSASLFNVTILLEKSKTALSHKKK